jgi:hypothetical protein
MNCGGSSEYSNENLEFINGGAFFDQFNGCELLKFSDPWN